MQGGFETDSFDGPDLQGRRLTSAVQYVLSFLMLLYFAGLKRGTVCPGPCKPSFSIELPLWVASSHTAVLAEPGSAVWA